MTTLTPSEIEEIRARDADYVDELPRTADVGTKDRRALLRHIDALAEERKAIVELLAEIADAMKRSIVPDDYPYGRETEQDAQVIAIADRVGYGRLMSLLSAAWRRKLIREGSAPVGGEFVAGPCRITVEKLLDRLATLRGES